MAIIFAEPFWVHTMSETIKLTEDQAKAIGDLMGAFKKMARYFQPFHLAETSEKYTKELFVARNSKEWPKVPVNENMRHISSNLLLLLVSQDFNPIVPAVALEKRLKHFVSCKICSVRGQMIMDAIRENRERQRLQ